MREEIYRPTSEEIQAELDYISRRAVSRRRFWRVMLVLLIIMAVGVLVFLHFFPVIRVKGNDMKPLLEKGQIVIGVRDPEVDRGDIIVFHHNNEVLIRRVIGLPGDEIAIRKNGMVMVNGEEQDEAYIEESSEGECDLEFPYEVPENEVFVLGDNRETAKDSRLNAFGCIADEDVIGKVRFRIWPFFESDSY